MVKKLIEIIIVTGVVVGLGALGMAVLDKKVKNPVNDVAQSQDPPTAQPQTQEFDKKRYSLDDPNSIWIIANKKRPIGEEFTPADLRAVDVAKRSDKSDEELMLRDISAAAMEELFDGAKNNGIDLMIGSAYRSFALQTTYYTNYVKTYGQAEADRFSARPGTSEHQTGLAADLSTPDRKCYLDTCFGETPAGKWIAEHAHEYGFVVRYSDGKEDITGYQYEPWHVRYVGKELAAEVFKSKQTLEEFFGL